MAIDWLKPIAMEPAGGGALVPVRLSGLNINGKGLYIYSKAWLSPLQATQFGPDDIGISSASANLATGMVTKSGTVIGKIVNVPADLLNDWTDPATGKEYLVREREVRRRIQQAVTAAGGTASDPIVKVHVTVERKSGQKDMLGSLIA